MNGEYGDEATLAPDSAILQRLVEASEALIQGIGPVRGKPCVQSVVVLPDLRNFPLSRACLAFWIEVRLENSADMCWFITITWTPNWTIEAGIRLNRYSEQEWIADLGEWTAVDAAEFGIHLDKAVRMTLDSLAAFDFCAIEAA